MPAPDDHARTSRLAGLTGGPLTLVRREAGRMPLAALTVALQAWERSRGVRSFALRRSNEALQVVAHTPLGRFLPQAVFDDGADAEAERIASAARDATTATAARKTATKPAPQRPDPADGLASATPASDATERKAASPTTSAAAEVGAPGAVSDKVERITEQLHIAEPAKRDDLPIPDFDNISLGSLRARLRSLSVEDLVTLREWEQAHANRLPVITLLDNRIAKVSADSTPATAYPSGDAPSDGQRQRT